MCITDKEKRIEEISRILAASVEGTLSGGEQAVLDEWLAESDRNRRIYRRLHDRTRLGEEYARFRSADYPNGWEELKSKIERRTKTVPLRRKLLRYAAAVVLLAFATWGVTFLFDPDADIQSDVAAILPGTNQAILEVGDGTRIPLTAESPKPAQALARHGISAGDAGLVYNEAESAIQPLYKGSEEPAMHTLTVPRGGEYKIVLADGTAVWLNSESTLRYPVKFSGDERRVELTGEGYFDVARDEGKRFTVSAGGIDIAVLGTEFNVMSYGDSREVETTLVNGRVNIITGNRNVALTPGKQALFNRENESIDIRAVDTRIYTAWKDGVFEFDSMPLESICKLLGRWYNVEFVFDDPQLANLTFTGAAKRDRSLVFILDLISDTRSIRYDMSGGKIRLAAK